MGQTQTHALTNIFFVMQALKRSSDCGIHHTLEVRQVKMVCDVPHLCQFIPVQACQYYINGVDING